MIYRARVIVTMDGPPIENGAVAVQDGVIRAVGSHGEVVRLVQDETTDPRRAGHLCPGSSTPIATSITATLRHVISPQKSFADWIRNINALKRSFHDDDYLDAIRRGFAESKSGVRQPVLNIETQPELLLRMPAPPLRTWWFYEMIDIRHRITTEKLVAGALAFFNQQPDWPGGFGLSPHAPYTASADLYRLAGECSRVTGMPLTTHAAESAEEDEMFRHARGPLYDSCPRWAATWAIAEKNRRSRTWRTKVAPAPTGCSCT